MVCLLLLVPSQREPDAGVCTGDAVALAQFSLVVAGGMNAAGFGAALSVPAIVARPVRTLAPPLVAALLLAVAALSTVSTNAHLERVCGG